MFFNIDLASAAPQILLLRSLSSLPYDILRVLFSSLLQHFSGSLCFLPLQFYINDVKLR